MQILLSLLDETPKSVPKRALMHFLRFFDRVPHCYLHPFKYIKDFHYHWKIILDGWSLVDLDWTRPLTIYYVIEHIEWVRSRTLNVQSF